MVHWCCLDTATRCPSERWDSLLLPLLSGCCFDRPSLLLLLIYRTAFAFGALNPSAKIILCLVMALRLLVLCWLCLFPLLDLAHVTTTATAFAL